MTEEENNLIEITDDEGNTIKCELYDIIEFDGSQYAILLEEDASDNSEMTVMKYTEEDGESIFETIEDDDEFERVSNYIENLEDEYEEDEE
ncbi:DUF1292 domain-containing protein [bacterium]|nr:DUF1292 domain-containing protein [bacterium]